MNPENIGENIPLRHSSLWRKPLLYEKQQKELPLCHLQLSVPAKEGISWRYRNNSVKLNSTINNTKSKRPRTALTGQQKEDKSMGPEFTFSQQLHDRSSRLTQSMIQLKQEGLSQGNHVALAAYPGVGCSPFIINDYHSRMVNPGYSRNIKGKHFTR